MSSKHFLPKDIDNFITNALKATLLENPNLSLLEKERVLFNSSADKTKVSLISGGGSGHEPGWYGFVCDGMLTASVQGDVFASPNYRNIQAAEKIVHSDAGTIFLITNYTGDNLYFGMAVQELTRKYGDSKIRLLRTTDDVAVPRSRSDMVGRRTLSGITLMFKVLGGCSQDGYDIDTIYEFGESVNRNIASINAGLDHVHIPTHGTDKDWGKLKENELEIGLGVHNEPGVKKLDYIPSNEELVETLLKYLLDLKDKERGFFTYEKNDQIALQINNLGGVSHIELLSILHETSKQLKEFYGITLCRVYLGQFVTSFNAPIFTLTLFNVTKAATPKFSSEKILDYLDRSVEATNWPSSLNYEAQGKIISNFEHGDDDEEDEKVDIEVDADELKSKITLAAERVVAREPDLTAWDTKLGDGDCGEGLKAGALATLEAINKAPLDGKLLQAMKTVLKVVKNDMGGTLGAILYIFLQGLLNEAERILKENFKGSATELLAQSCKYALSNLENYTKAREGHRTVMDVLIPFCNTFSETKDIKKGVEVAYKGAEATKEMTPKLGRATYVGSIDEKLPDPGAYGLYEILKAFE